MKKIFAVLLLIVVFSTMIFARGNGKSLKNGNSWCGNLSSTSEMSGNYSGRRNGSKSKNIDGKGNGQKIQDKVQRQERLFFNDENFKAASIKKYDIDGDGILSSTEHQTMYEDRMNLKKACDIDEDGKLSDSEFDIFRQSLIDDLGL